MREALAPRATRRGRFSGTFVRLGTKRGWQGRTAQTVLLCDVRDHAGLVVADHVWMALTKSLAVLALQPGDVVFFDARVTLYQKGYRGYREGEEATVSWDYKLSRPTRCVKVATEQQESLL